MRQWPSTIVILTVLLLAAPVIALAASPTPLSLDSITLAATTITGGQSVTGSVILSGPAPAGGLVVQPLSTDPAVATVVPASVTVAAGATTASFTVTTLPVAQPRTVGIHATVGAVNKIADLRVRPPVPSSVTLVPATVAGGNSSTGTVTLNGQAPSGGSVVLLLSSNRNVATLPVSVTVAAGATTASFTVATVPVAQSTPVLITAAAGGEPRDSLLNVVPPVPSSVTLAPSTIVGGQGSTGQVSLSGPAPSGGSVVGLSSSNLAVATIPTSVTVAAGATTASFTVATVPILQSTTVTITAFTGGQPKTVLLNVVPPIPSSVTLVPASVAGGQRPGGTVILSGPAPSGGLVVRLASSNPAVATVPASVTVAAGETTGSFTVGTVRVARSTAVTITASAGGGNTTGKLEVVAPLIPSSVTLAPASVASGQSSVGTVILSGRAPADGLVVQLASSNPAVATVRASVTVAAGETTGSFTVATVRVLQLTTAVTITASAGGVTKTAQLTVTR